MPKEPHRPDEYCVLATYPNQLLAEIDAGFLRSEGVAARVGESGAFPSHVPETALWVDASLVHRARWLLKLNAVSEAELNFLATGELPDENLNPKPDEPEPKL
jgi:hypothetical protein